MVLHSSLPDFILFLYVHMSHADSNYDPLELAAIKAKMNDLFVDGTDMEKKLYRAIREYNSFDKSKLNELFEDTFKHFGKYYHPPLKNKVFGDLNEIMRADGKVNQAETKALESLKQIIELCAEKKQ